MRVISSAFLALACLAAAAVALPAKFDDDVEIIPLEAGKVGKEPSLLGGEPDFGSGPFYSSFDDLFGSLANYMAAMKARMDALFGRLPSFGDSNSTFPSQDFPGFPNIDLSKANTTSTVKVIDGHKVVINETDYQQSGDDGAPMIHVKIINVAPEEEPKKIGKDAEELSTTSRTMNKDQETSIENEISHKTEAEMKPTITSGSFDEIDSTSRPKPFPLETWENLEPFESFEGNNVDDAEYVFRPYFPPQSYGRDTYVNEILASRSGGGAAMNPDAEMLSEDELRSLGNPSSKLQMPR